MATRDKDNFDKVRCSFCGKPRSMVSRLIMGPEVNICDECVRNAVRAYGYVMNR